MNIGEASAQTGLPTKTIRYYEEIGLVVADRQSNGYRDYSLRHIEVLSFLKRAREFGFSIEDCRKLLGIYNDDHISKEEVRALAKHHLNELKHKAQEIQNLAETLQTLVASCCSSVGEDCPIIDELAKGPHKKARSH